MYERSYPRIFAAVVAVSNLVAMHISIVWITSYFKHLAIAACRKHMLLPYTEPKSCVETRISLCKNRGMKNTTESLRDQLQFGLADRLAKSLHVAGMTNLDMAKVLEVSPNTVSNYINGNTQPRKLYLREWALKTGVPLEWLKTGIDTTENPHPHDTDGGDHGASCRTRTGPCGLQGRTFAPVIDITTKKEAA